LRLAADVAVRHGSRLTALFAREWSRAQLDRRKAAELGLVSSKKMRLLHEGIATSIKVIADRLQTTLDELISDRGIHVALLSIDGPAAMAVPQYARYADLCILGQNELEEPASVNHTFSEQLLFATGQPVLLALRTVYMKFSAATSSSPGIQAGPRLVR
jgi:hypothetical protein